MGAGHVLETMSEEQVDDGSYVTGMGDEVVVATMVVTTSVLALSVALLLHRLTRTGGRQLVHPEMVCERTNGWGEDTRERETNGGTMQE